jgi:hypothetical protein
VAEVRSEKHAVQFLKVALALKVLTKAEAKRCLGALAETGSKDAGALAEALGLLDADQRRRVETKLGHLRARKALRRSSRSRRAPQAEGEATAGSKSAAAEPDSEAKPRAAPRAPAQRTAGGPKRSLRAPSKRGRDGRSAGRSAKEQQPERRRTSPVLILAGALASGALIAVGVAVALSGGESVVEAEAVSTAAPAVTAPVAPADAPVDSADELELTLRSAARLQELGQERTALEVLDAFRDARGRVHRVEAARRVLLADCEGLLAAEEEEARALAERGDALLAAHRVARLGRRLPTSLLPRVDVLARDVERLGAVASARAEPRSGPAASPSSAAEPNPVDDGDPFSGFEDAIVVDFELGEGSSEPVAKAPRRRANAPAGEALVGRRPKVARAGAARRLPEAAPGSADAVDRPDTDSPLAGALGQLLLTKHTLRTSGELSVRYRLQDEGEVEDFESLGFDKFLIGRAAGGKGIHTGLECGVGSQRAARFRHVVPLRGDFEVDLKLWLNYCNSRSKLVFMLGEKVGVSFGQQVVKVSKRGSLRPVAGQADRSVFRGERLVQVKITGRDGQITVRCDGKQTAQAAVPASVLRGRFGLLAKDVRLQITDLSIRGLVDAGDL